MTSGIKTGIDGKQSALYKRQRSYSNSHKLHLEAHRHSVNFAAANTKTDGFIAHCNADADDFRHCAGGAVCRQTQSVVS